MPPFRIGYACISLVMAERGIKTNRGLILRTAHAKGLNELQALALANVQDLRKILLYNEEHGIKFFRITSNLFPHLDNPRLLVKGYNIDFARADLALAGKTARELGHRLTMHPSHFVKLGSPRADVVRQSIADLTAHAEILLALGMSPELGSVCVIHAGGRYGEPAGPHKDSPNLTRWADEYHKMPQRVRQFIVLENDEHWSVSELLPFCEQHQIPLVVDFFHDTLRSHADVYELMPRVIHIWRARGIPPKCHLSAQAPKKRRGAHSNCVEEIPPNLYALCAREQIDICLEVKGKDVCLLEVVESLRKSNPEYFAK